jgi:hypothetical protein
MNPRTLTLILIVLALAASRFLPHPPNVSPIAAMALFAGAHFIDRRAAFLVPLGALLLSDLLLGFHSTMAYVYGAFALMVVIGLWLRAHAGVVPLIGAALASSVLFFVITNFGSWLSHNMYPKTADGLLAAYTAAIPFFRNTVLGDVMFTLLVFGGFEFAQQRLAFLRAREPASPAQV